MKTSCQKDPDQPIWVWMSGHSYRETTVLLLFSIYLTYAFIQSSLQSCDISLYNRLRVKGLVCLFYFMMLPSKLKFAPKHLAVCLSFLWQLEDPEDTTELTPEEDLAEKLKLKKLQEDSDLELAKDAFGELFLRVWTVWTHSSTVNILCVLSFRCIK